MQGKAKGYYILSSIKILIENSHQIREAKGKNKEKRYIILYISTIIYCSLNSNSNPTHQRL